MTKHAKGPTMVATDHAGLPTERHVLITKAWRLTLNILLRQIQTNVDLHTVDGRFSRERALAITKIEEARMWLGMDLKSMNDGVSCYTEANNPTNARVDPPVSQMDDEAQRSNIERLNAEIARLQAHAVVEYERGLAEGSDCGPILHADEQEPRPTRRTGDAT